MMVCRMVNDEGEDVVSVSVAGPYCAWRVGVFSAVSGVARS